jgi:hypothetical protein
LTHKALFLVMFVKVLLEEIGISISKLNKEDTLRSAGGHHLILSYRMNAKARNEPIIIVAGASILSCS